MIELLRKISRWADEADWRSWVTHGVIAIPIVFINIFLAILLSWLGLHPSLAAGFVGNTTFWAIREGEQIAHEKMSGEVVPKTRALDHRMDWVVPTLVSAAIVLAAQVLLL